MWSLYRFIHTKHTKLYPLTSTCPPHSLYLMCPNGISKRKYHALKLVESCFFRSFTEDMQITDLLMSLSNNIHWPMAHLCTATGGDLITAQLLSINKRSRNDKSDAYKFFSAQSPLDRTKTEIRRRLEAAVVYRVSVLINVSTFGRDDCLWYPTIAIHLSITFLHDL